MQGQLPPPPGPQDLQLLSEPVLGGARPATCDLGEVVHNVLERIHAEFGSLLQQAAVSTDEARKRLLLYHLHIYRQQLLRLVALVQWHPKAPAQRELVDPGKVLDIARQHCQNLQSADFELYNARTRRLFFDAPMFDVQTALDVLRTGTYDDLPSSIEELRGANKQSADQQRRQIRRVGQLVASSLLKVTMPDGMQVTDMRDGWAVLQLPGLYDARVTLVPALQPPDEPADTAAGAAAAAAGPSSQPRGADGGEQDEVSSAVPTKQQRWRWLLLDFSIPVGQVQGPALHQSQITNLLRDLNERMRIAADAGVYAKRKELQAEAAAAAGGVVKQEPADAAGAVGAPAPSASAAPQASNLNSRLTGGSAAAAAAAAAGRAGTHRAQNLAYVERVAADELSAPIAALHSVLSDVAGRLLMDAARAVARQLAGPNGCWHGNVSIDNGTTSGLDFGFTVAFWSKAVPLLPLLSMSAAGAQASTARFKGSATDASGPRPRIEIGVSASGQVQAVCNVSAPASPATASPSDAVTPMPPPGTPSAADAAAAHAARPQGVALKLDLDAVRVNVDELLLRAATSLAWQELTALHHALLREVQTMAIPGMPWDIRLTSSTLSALPASAQPLVNALTVQQALVTTSPSAVQAGRQARAMHQDHEDPSLQPQQGSDARVVGEGLDMTVQFPVIEMLCQGEVIMRVSKSLYTGRVLLHTGTSGDTNLQSMASWSAREEDLNTLMSRTYQQATTSQTPAGPAASSSHSSHQAAASKVLAELAKRLAKLFQDHQRSLAISMTMTIARRLNLHLGGPSTRIINAFASERPCPPGTPACMQPRSLSFVLGGDHPASHSGVYSLFVVACSDQQVPLKMLKLVPVPEHIYLRHSLAGPAGGEGVASQTPRAADGDARGGPLSRYGSRMFHAPSNNSLPSALSTDVQQTWDTQPENSVAGPSGRQGSVSSGRRGSRFRRELPAGAADESDAQHAASPSQGTRDMAAEMTAVVAWCRRRCVWEKLLHQLQALLVDFCELQGGPNGSSALRLLACAGVRFPCYIARRKGASPACVGIRSVTVTTDGDIEREQVVMTVQGTWLRSHDHATSQQHSDSHQQQHGTHTAGSTGRNSQGGHGHQPSSNTAAAHSLCNGGVRGAHQPGTSAAGSASGHSAAGGSEFDDLRAETAAWRSDGSLRLTYSLACGQSAVDMLLDVFSMLRLQTLLARLECMAVGDAYLTCNGRSPAGSPAAAAYAAAGPSGDAAAAAAAAAGKRVRDVGEDGAMDWEVANGGDGVPAAKRARAQQPLANGTMAGVTPNGPVDMASNGVNGTAQGHSTGGVGDSMGSTGCLSWTWGTQGASMTTISLAQYSLTSATLVHQTQKAVRSRSESQHKGGHSKVGQAPVQQQGSETRQIVFTARWQAAAAAAGRRVEDAGPAAGAAAGPAAGAAAPPGGAALTNASAPGDAGAGGTWSDLLACRVDAAAGGRVYTAGPPSSDRAAPAPPLGSSAPMCSFLQALQQMAALGEEGLLLDALVFSAQPMLDLDKVLNSHNHSVGLGKQPESADKQLRVLNVADRAPFQHEVMVQVVDAFHSAPGPSAAAAAGAAASRVAVLTVVPMANLRTWVHVSVPASWVGAAAFLLAVLHALQGQLGAENVYVSTPWSHIQAPASATPRSRAALPAPPASAFPGGRRHLWVLVDNAQLGQATEIVLQACHQPAKLNAMQQR